jgi:precorrin-8X/cobalt-precorrin-8 methylmutase
VTNAIEAESYRILGERVDLTGWSPAERAVVARVVHASADVEYAATLRFSPGAAEAGAGALRAGAAVVTDVQMVRHGITAVPAACYLEAAGGEEGDDRGETRSARALRLAAAHHPEGAVLVVGCAPTALLEVVRLARAGRLRPALVVGLPVGFVGAAEAKAALRASGLPAVSNVGEKGGSAVAAAAVNALARLAAAPASRGDRP